MSMNPVGQNPLEPQGPDNKRLLITVALCTLLWLVFNQFFFMPPEGEKKGGEQAAAGAVEGAPAAGAAAGTGQPSTISAGDAVEGATSDRLEEKTLSFQAKVAEATGGESFAVKGGYLAEVSSHGAELKSFELTGYDDNSRRDERAEAAGATPHINLARGEHKGARPMALVSRGGDVQLPADATYEIVEQTDRSATLSRLTPSGVRVTRSYTFDEDRFAFKHTVTLKNESDQKKTAALDLLLVGEERPGERGEGGMFMPPPDKLSGVCAAAGEREKFTSDSLEEAQSFPGKVAYAGLDRHYFLAAVVPTAQTPTEGCRVVPFVEGAEAEGAQKLGFTLHLQNAPVELAPGEVRTLSYESYFGPKQLGLLESFGHGLSENIDFGIFGIISRPMLWLMVQFQKFTGNFGIAIILLTLVIKILTFPLTQKSYKSMQEMKKLAPEIKELQKKYGNDRATLGQKQMALYQEKGVNPMAGCFPVLVQLPIWFALYRTLASAVELYQQPFYLWITDLTQPDASPLWGFPILPLIVGALMLAQTALQPPPEDQPQMKYVMWGMPVMFTFFMLGMASGLSIYMITNSILTMAQQIYVKRRYS